jgi:hypothetical protein
MVDREAKTLRLIEVKSKININSSRVFINEAKHLFDEAVLKNIISDDEFKTTCVVVFKGKTGFIPRKDDVLLLVNIEDFLIHYRGLGHYFDQIAAEADEKRASLSPKPFAEQLREDTVKRNREHSPLEKSKSKTEPGIGD